jgi:hypothetical protein
MNAMMSRPAQLILTLEAREEPFDEATRNEVIMYCAGCTEQEAIGFTRNIGNPLACSRSAYALAALAGFNPEVIHHTSVCKLEEQNEEADDAAVAIEMTALLLQARVAFRQ